MGGEGNAKETYFVKPKSALSGYKGQRSSAEVLEKIMNNYSKTSFALLFFLFLRFSAGIGANQDECEVPSCSPKGPAIRFPFRQKDQPSHCGYPGFVISCTGKETILELPHSVKLSVDKIKYKSQEIVVHDPEFCLQRQLQNFTLSASPFQFKIRRFYASEIMDFTFFSCSSNKRFQSIPCRILDRNPIYAVWSFMDLDSIDLSSCQKLYSLSLPNDIGDIFNGKDHFTLTWSEGICGNCEKAGEKCRLKRNSKAPETECLPKGAKEKILIAGIIVGFFALVLVTILLHRVHRSNKSKKASIVRVEKFLEDYKALKPSRYSYNDIKKLTNHFKDKLGQGGYGTVYKGKLSNEVLVAVKILNDAKGNGDEFINEVGTIGGIHHVNIVRLVGFCADGAKRALIYEFLPNESLEKFIFSTSTKHPLLGWEKLQDIAIGIAKGIEYLHQGCDQRILHFDIKPHNILLDENFNPKISDFGLAKLCSKDQSAVSMTIARGTMGYIAPEVLSRNFGNVSYKSDVYSFGMVLLEMVGGRKNIDMTVGTDQIFFPEWIYHQIEQGEDLHIRSVNEEDIKIIKKLTIVGLWCIQWHPIDRPSMKVVVQMLERGENLTIPPNPFASIGSAEGGGGGNIRRRKRYVQQELTIISE